MKFRPTPSQEELRKRLTYDPFQGTLYFKPGNAERFKSLHSCRTWNTKFAGKPAFNGINADGYRAGTFDYVAVLAHRIVWKLIYGYDAEQVDHQNGIRHDNSLLNLRDANDTSNSKNRHLRVDNSSGYSGVYKIHGREAWTVEITHSRNTIYLGSYNSFDRAVSIRKTAEVMYRFHPNHGRDDEQSRY